MLRYTLYKFLPLLKFEFVQDHFLVWAFIRRSSDCGNWVHNLKDISFHFVLRKAAAAAAAGDRRNIMIRNGVVVVVVVAGGLLHARRQRNKEPCRAICCGWKRVADGGWEGGG